MIIPFFPLWDGMGFIHRLSSVKCLQITILNTLSQAPCTYFGLYAHVFADNTENFSLFRWKWKEGALERHNLLSEVMSLVWARTACSLLSYLLICLFAQQQMDIGGCWALFCRVGADHQKLLNQGRRGVESCKSGRKHGPRSWARRRLGSEPKYPIHVQ